MKSAIKERVTKKAHSDPRVTIDLIHSNIVETMDDDKKDEYYLDNGLLLSKYYSKDIQTPQPSQKSNKGILNYFNKKPVNNDTTVCSYNLVNEYMSNIDDTFNKGITNYNLDKCKICKSNMKYSIVDSELVCLKCGYTEDIIVNSGGENIAPGRVEALLAIEPEIEQVMVDGDHRPWLAGVIVPSEEARSKATSDGELKTLIIEAVDRANTRLSQIERVRRFVIAPEAFSTENSQLTPTLKVRRHVVRATYADQLDALYKRR